MGQQPKPVITDAPWINLTYQIIGLAMELHNELGPGHRESAYHNGMVVKLSIASRIFESEPTCRKPGRRHGGQGRMSRLGDGTFGHCRIEGAHLYAES